MRILFVSFYFPPWRSIASVRTSKMAKYLTMLGHDVRILSADPQGNPTNSIPIDIPQERIKYTKWINLREPARKSIGISGGNDAPWFGTNLSKTWQIMQYLIRNIRAVIYFPDPRNGWLPYAVTNGNRLVKEWKPDVIYASSPPETCLLVGHILSRLHNIPWIAEYRDLWVDYWYDFPKWRLNFDKKVEKRVIASARGLVTISDPHAEILKSNFSKPTAAILNGFDPDDYPADYVINPSKEFLRIVFTGGMLPQWHKPDTLFQALNMLGPAANKIRIEFFGTKKSSILPTARKYKIEQLIQFHDPVPYSESLRTQCEADILLHFVYNDPDLPGVFSGKLFEYFGARRPILSVGNIQDNALADLIESREIGYVLNDPVEIANKIENWFAHKSTFGFIPSVEKNKYHGLSREEEAKQLEDFLYSLINCDGNSTAN